MRNKFKMEKKFNQSHRKYNSLINNENNSTINLVNNNNNKKLHYRKTKLNLPQLNVNK